MWADFPPIRMLSNKFLPDKVRQCDGIRFVACGLFVWLFRVQLISSGFLLRSSKNPLQAGFRLIFFLFFDENLCKAEKSQFLVDLAYMSTVFLHGLSGKGILKQRFRIKQYNVVEYKSSPKEDYRPNRMGLQVEACYVDASDDALLHITMSKLIFWSSVTAYLVCVTKYGGYINRQLPNIHGCTLLLLT